MSGDVKPQRYDMDALGCIPTPVGDWVEYSDVDPLVKVVEQARTLVGVWLHRTQDGVLLYPYIANVANALELAGITTYRDREEKKEEPDGL